MKEIEVLEESSKSKHNDWYRRIDLLGPGLLILISVGVAIAYILVSTDRTLTALEGTMFQLFILSLGLAGSFLFGRQSANQAAKQLIKPHARSAFRRLIFLYQSLSRLAVTIQQGKQQASESNANMVLEKLDAIVVEQIATANDALEDWRDIVPEDVEELMSKYKD